MGAHAGDPGTRLMQIRLKKGRDGPDSLACVRDDGTSTWRRLQRALAVHDLAHYAVETGTGISDGFFGLVARGWDIDDFADAEERARVPPGALWVELIVNAFMTEAMSGQLLDAGSFHASLSRSAANANLELPRALADEEIARIRGTIAALVARWRSLAPSETLELTFPGVPGAR